MGMDMELILYTRSLLRVRFRKAAAPGFFVRRKG
jgi:hypothetical protein